MTSVIDVSMIFLAGFGSADIVGYVYMILYVGGHLPDS